MDFTLKDEPIIQSRLDLDFYKFTMGQLIFKKHAKVPTKFALTNRTSSVSLPAMIPLQQLREQLDHVKTLRFNNSELHYLRGTNEYQERMFEEDYLQFLKNMQLPDYELSEHDGQFCLEFPGEWSGNTYWETMGLSIINELYYKNIMSKKTKLERDAVYATGVKNLYDKVQKLKLYPSLTFTDFGTRRRFSRDWQKYVVQMMAAELPDQLKGTSNTKLAMDLGLMPTGTAAHEMDMGYSGIYHGSHQEILESHKRFLSDWRQMYGWGLSINLTDTYGTDFFFRDFSREEALHDKGLRHDSGDPFIFGDKAIDFYYGHRIDATTKMLIFSDGLNLERMIDLHSYFLSKIINTFGWGTNLTNDLGLMPLSLVIKLVMSNGHGTVKLSDNLNKATGRPADVAMFKEIFGYVNEKAEVCTY